MMWVADPHMVHRKETGFKVLLFLVLFAGLLYLAKRRLWTDVAH
jgi:ubiquinol-cytochrome c reductase cytochrome c1 subunit